MVDTNRSTKVAKVQTEPEKFIPSGFRPLGLIIAIVTTGLIYGIGPLLPVALVGIVNLRGSNIVGAQMNNPLMWFNVVLAMNTLLLCVLAWRGRPRWSRWALLAIVWFATLEQVLTQFAPLPESSGMVISGSLDSVISPFLLCKFVLYLVVPIYITWYLNRAPARAFYR